VTQKRKPFSMPSRKQAVFATTILVLALLIGAAALIFRGGGHLPAGTGVAQVGGPFALTDHNGRRVTEKDFRGKYMLVFFGYTYCPDVCPTELQVMTQAIAAMGAAGEAIQPVFISVDPVRDTPEILKAYVENFGPRLIGLTGSAEDVAAVAKAFRVYYKKVVNGDANAYLMDHSSIIYLMDPDGHFAKHFTFMTDAKALSEALIAAIGGSS
jgi:cytochrome oxidase Cu insertion factor (SCO1/SenC/PrrC family)